MLFHSPSLEMLNGTTDGSSVSLFSPTSFRSSPDSISSGSGSPLDDIDTHFWASPTLESVTSRGSLPSSPSNDLSSHKDSGSNAANLNQNTINPHLTISPRKRTRRKADLIGPRSPDRFLPVRQVHLAAAPPFRLSKNPELLSPNEKLFRQHDSLADPFALNYGTTADTTRRNDIDRRLTPHHLPRQIYDIDLRGRRDNDHSSSRQISGGAVWSVGGHSAAAGARPRGPLPAVPDGTGGLLASGTSAPIYQAKFLSTDTTSQKLESHESRLATALDIDQAVRVLNIPPTSPTRDRNKDRYEDNAPFPWGDLKIRSCELMNSVLLLSSYCPA